MNIDWHNQRWCADPPVLPRLPQARGQTVLTGSRRTAFDARVAQAGQDGLLELFREPNARPGTSPCPCFSSSSSTMKQGARWAAALGVSYTPCFALQEAALLPPLSSAAPTSAPEFGIPTQTTALGTWRHVADRDVQAGLGGERRQLGLEGSGAVAVGAAGIGGDQQTSGPAGSRSVRARFTSSGSIRP